MDEFTANTIKADPPRTPYARVSALAKRLGVSPDKGGGPPSVFICVAEGERYDFYELVEAVLNRLDAVK